MRNQWLSRSAPLVPIHSDATLRADFRNANL
jgi:hypothetical protein